MHLRHKTQRINPYPTLHQLKMQMETCTVTGTAYITYNLPCRHGFARRDGCCCHVGIPRGQARAIIQQNLIAVAVVPAADQHRATVGGENRRPLRRGNVRTAMPGVAEGVNFPEVAGYISMPRQRPAQFTASTDLLLTVMCRMYPVTGSGSGSPSVGSGVADTSSTSASISCIMSMPYPTSAFAATKRRK